MTASFASAHNYLLRAWILSTALLTYFALFGSLPTEWLALIAIGTVHLPQPLPLAPSDYSYVVRHIYVANPYFIVAAWQHPHRPEYGEHIALLWRPATSAARYHDILFRYRKNNKHSSLTPSHGGFGI